MNLENITNVDLVKRMEKLVRTERKITHLILQHIIEIETRRIYAELGYDGMYTYLTRGLGYSEAAAYRRLQSARLLKKVPEVSEKIESGALHLTQLTQVQKCLKESTQQGQLISSSQTLEVLHKLENKNTFETEKVLAKEFSLPVKSQELLRPQKDDSVRLEITLTQEQFQELTTAKESLSHIRVDGNWAEIITTLARKFNAFRNPKSSGKVEKETKPIQEKVPTQRVIATKVENLNDKSQRRRAIPIRIKRILLEKAHSCCEYVHPETGQRCGSRFQLQVEHIKPWALGGSDDKKNLRILCRTHNLLMARKAGL